MYRDKKDCVEYCYGLRRPAIATACAAANGIELMGRARDGMKTQVDVFHFMDYLGLIFTEGVNKSL